MTAGYTRGNKTPIEDGGIHGDFDRLLAVGTRHAIGFRWRQEDLILAGLTFKVDAAHR